MLTLITTGSKGGTGKTLITLNLVLSILLKKESVNILIIDENSVNTDLFDILAKATEGKKEISFNSSIQYESLKNERKTLDFTFLNIDHMKLLNKSDFQLCFIKEAHKFQAFENAYDFVQCMSQIIKKSEDEHFNNNKIDYVFIDTNYHIGNIVYKKNKTESKKYNEMRKVLFQEMNTKFIFFWTWADFLDPEEYQFLKELNNSEPKITKQLLNVINMYSFIGNVNNANGRHRKWAAISKRKYSSQTEFNSFEVLLEAGRLYNSKITKNSGLARQSNYKNLTKLGEILEKLLDDKLEEGKRPRNLLIMPQYFFKLQDYNESIRRHESTNLKTILEKFNNEKDFFDLIYEFSGILL